MEVEKPQIQVPRVKLGSKGLEVSVLSFGRAGLSGVLDTLLSHQAGCHIIKEACIRGITFFDTADIYEENDNEIMIGKSKILRKKVTFLAFQPLKQLPRNKVPLSTKFGVTVSGNFQFGMKGTPEYVGKCCKASLKYLDVEYIDLYYQYRVDTSVTIEDTMGELKKLVEEGKSKYIGLPEASVDTIRRAHSVHPITALQMEYSLWTQEIEDEIIPLGCMLSIGIVAYSPLGHGFFGGKAVVESLPNGSLLGGFPRFVHENLEKNKVVYGRIAKLAAKHARTPAQLALAWLLHQGEDIVPIPGTTKVENLDANIGSLAVKLTKEDLKEIGDVVPYMKWLGKESTLLPLNVPGSLLIPHQNSCKLKQINSLRA